MFSALLVIGCFSNPIPDEAVAAPVSTPVPEQKSADVPVPESVAAKSAEGVVPAVSVSTEVPAVPGNVKNR